MTEEKSKPKKKQTKRRRAKVTIPGVEKPVYVSGRSKAELERKKAEVRERYIDGVRTRDVTFHALVIEWFETFKQPNIRAESTLINWRNAINLHVLPCFPDKQLIRAIRRADLQRCVDATRGMSYIVTNLVCSVIRHTFDYAMAEGLIRVNPALSLVKPPAPDRGEREAFTNEQERRLLATAERHPSGLIIYLLYYLGLRRGEMLALRWGDFDFKRKVVHIQRDIDFNARGSSSLSIVGELKNRAANRLVPLPDELIEILTPLRSLPHLYLISERDNLPLNANLFRTRWAYLMRDAGFLELRPSYLERVERWKKEGKKVIPPNLSCDYKPLFTPHSFRHHYITAKVEADERSEIIMSIVGHSDYSTTINIYTHIKNRIGDVEPTLLSQVFRKNLQQSKTI